VSILSPSFGRALGKERGKAPRDLSDITSKMSPLGLLLPGIPLANTWPNGYIRRKVKVFYA
jgi:hypothetical protein